MDAQKKQQMDLIFQKATGQRPQEAFSGNKKPIKERIAEIQKEKVSGVGAKEVAMNLIGNQRDIIKETAGDFVDTAKNSFNAVSNRADKVALIGEKMKAGEQGVLRSRLQQAGQLAGAGADLIGEVSKGAVNVFLSDRAEKAVTEVIGKLGAKAMANPEVQNIVNKYNALPEDKKADIDAIGGVVSLVSNFIGVNEISAGAKAVVSKVDDAARQVIKTPTKKVTTEALPLAKEAVVNPSGVGQIISDITDRVPRAIRRGKDVINESAIKASKISKATPEVAEAIKVNLKDDLISKATSADAPTKEAYRKVLDIAESTGKKEQPSIISGELAGEQLDIIMKQKKEVGGQIGKLTKDLSKKTKVSIDDALSEVDNTLQSQGITPSQTDNGVKLDFKGSKYTPAERTKIQQLYDLASEGGSELTPSQIKAKDELFSKLKRESNFEGIGDLLIETDNGTKSMFSIFRDIYSSKLDSISPELKKLNNQYRQISQITDDIEDSIFKTPNFNITKSVDPAEFAKVNLRRIFGEAQSSPVYEAIADKMDAFSRSLGYAGASPKDVADFTNYIRELYPEVIPKAGFQGGIRAGVSDIIESISKAGAPNIKDQQKALRLLLK